MFNNWKDSDVAKEYTREYLHIAPYYGDFFPTHSSFEQAYKDAPVVEIDESTDMRIDRRSHTDSYDELLNLISSYRSFKSGHRTEKHLQDIYKGFEGNSPMEYPIVLKDGNKLIIMGGNTRMDVAFQLGINPKVKLITVPNTIKEAVENDVKNFLKDFPYQRQYNSWDCGAACTLDLVFYYGIQDEKTDWDFRLNNMHKYLKSNPKDGTNSEQIVKFLNGLKVDAFAKESSVEELKSKFDDGYVAMVALQAYTDRKDKEYSKAVEDGHWVVMIGYDDAKIYFSDPSSSIVSELPWDEFELRWKDVDANKKVNNLAIYTKHEKGKLVGKARYLENLESDKDARYKAIEVWTQIGKYIKEKFNLSDITRRGGALILPLIKVDANTQYKDLAVAFASFLAMGSKDGGYGRTDFKIDGNLYNLIGLAMLEDLDDTDNLLEEFKGVRDIFIHEFVHYLDEKRTHPSKIWVKKDGEKKLTRVELTPEETFEYSTTKYRNLSKSDPTIAKAYYNNPFEMNAYYQMAVEDIKTKFMSPEYLNKLEYGFEHFYQQALSEFEGGFLANITDDNKFRLKKRLYKVYLELISDYNTIKGIPATKSLTEASQRGLLYHFTNISKMMLISDLGLKGHNEFVDRVNEPRIKEQIPEIVYNILKKYKFNIDLVNFNDMQNDSEDILEVRCKAVNSGKEDEEQRILDATRELQQTVSEGSLFQYTTEKIIIFTIPVSDKIDPKNVVSVTRDAQFNIVPRLMAYTLDVRITLDGNAISENFKINPLSYKFKPSHVNMMIDDTFERILAADESEEQIILKKGVEFLPFNRRYVKEVRFLHILRSEAFKDGSYLNPLIERLDTKGIPYSFSDEKPIVTKLTEKVDYIKWKHVQNAKPNIKIEKELIGSFLCDNKKHKVKIYRVDGHEVRGKYSEDFLEGGHGYVYSFIPKDEVWIENMHNDDEEKDIIVHETTEYIMMRNTSMGYNDSHEIADSLELIQRDFKGADKLKESKQVGTLYHFTSMSSLGDICAIEIIKGHPPIQDFDRPQFVLDFFNREFGTKDYQTVGEKNGEDGFKMYIHVPIGLSTGNSPKISKADLEEIAKKFADKYKFEIKIGKTPWSKNEYVYTLDLTKSKWDVDVVSATRNPNFNKIPRAIVTSLEVRITLNGNNLSENHKISPYQYLNFSKMDLDLNFEYGIEPGSTNLDEMEERIFITHKQIGIPLKKEFVEEVRIFPLGYEYRYMRIIKDKLSKLGIPLVIESK